MHKRRDVILIALIVSVAVLAACIRLGGDALLIALGTSVEVSPPVILKGMAEQGGSFVSDAGAGEKMLSVRVPVERDQAYLLCFRPDRLSRRVPFIVDLQGDGYDNQEQEFHPSLVTRDAGRDVCGLIESGQPPEVTVLRLFHYATSAPVVSRVAVYRVPRLVAAMSRLVPLAGFLALAAAFWLMLRGVLPARRARITAMRQRLEAAGTAALLMPIMGLAGASLLALSLPSPYPSVFGDERTYAFFAKYGYSEALGDAVGFVSTLPRSFAYYFVYQGAFAFGKDYLLGARIINTLLLVASVIPLYGTARQFLPRGRALGFAAVAIACPATIAVSFFMPEAMYFFLFWTAVWAYVARWSSTRPSGEAIAGIVLALASLTKSHAIMLVPAFAAASVASSPWGGKGGGMRIAAMKVVVLFAAYFATRVILGLLLTGVPEFSLFGGYLGDARGMLTLSNVVADLRNVGLVLARHGSLVVLQYGLPLALAVGYLPQIARNWRSQTLDGQRKTMLVVLALCTVLGLTVVAARFTVSAIGSGPYETLGRLHVRYYSFSLPMLLLAGMALLTGAEVRGARAAGARLPAILLILGAVASLFLIDRQFIYPNEAPDALILASTPIALVVLGASVLSIGLWIWKGAALSAWAPLAVAALSYFGFHYLYHDRFRLGEVPQAEDRAGLAVRALVGEEHLDDGVLVTDYPRGDARIPRLLFQLNSLAPARAVAQGAEVNLDREFPRARWALTQGGARLIGSLEPEIRLSDDIRLFRVSAKPGRLPPSGSGGSAATPAAASQAGYQLSGTHEPEDWGSWSKDAAVRVRLREPVSGRLAIMITGHAFGPNVGRPLTLAVGGVSKEVTFGAVSSVQKVVVETAGPFDQFEIRGIVPTSPLSLGASADPRTLGLGISGIKIDRVTSP